MKSQYFLQLRVLVTEDTSEVVADFLFGFGATGLQEEQNELHAFFEQPFEQEPIINALTTFLNSQQALHHIAFPISIQADVLENRDWTAEWKKTLKPLKVSENILIKPTWVDTPQPPPPIIIEIDPEMAFGSGEHATTRMTLQLAEKNFRPHLRVLDVGTGTGVLAIGALKLGAAMVCGFDNDPIAAHTAWRNAEKNNVTDRFTTFAGDIYALRLEPYDLILANVNRTQIINMLPQMKKLLAQDGVLVISGILDTEEQLIRDSCAEHGLSITDMRREQEWLAFETRKR